MNNKTRSPFILLSLLAICLVACHDTYTLCDQSRQVNINGRFFTLGPGGTAVPAPPSSLSVKGINGNPLITNVLSPELFSLTLTPNSDSAKFIFTIANAAPPDTVTYFYSTQETLLSANCGNINTFTLNQVKTTNHTLDSVAIISPNVDTRLAINVRFFY